MRWQDARRSDNIEDRRGMRVGGGGMRMGGIGLGGLLVHGYLQEPLALHTASLVELEGESSVPGLMTLKSLYHPH